MLLSIIFYKSTIKKITYLQQISECCMINSWINVFILHFSFVSCYYIQLCKKTNKAILQKVAIPILNK